MSQSKRWHRSLISSLRQSVDLRQTVLHWTVKSAALRKILAVLAFWEIIWANRDIRTLFVITILSVRREFCTAMMIHGARLRLGFAMLTLVCIFPNNAVRNAWSTEIVSFSMNLQKIIPSYVSLTTICVHRSVSVTQPTMELNVIWGMSNWKRL